MDQRADCVQIPLDCLPPRESRVRERLQVVARRGGIGWQLPAMDDVERAIEAER